MAQALREIVLLSASSVRRRGADHPGRTSGLLSLQLNVITRFQPSKRLREQHMQPLDRVVPERDANLRAIDGFKENDRRLLTQHDLWLSHTHWQKECFSALKLYVGRLLNVEGFSSFCHPY